MSKRKEFFRTNSSSHMLPKVSTLAELSLAPFSGLKIDDLIKTSKPEKTHEIGQNRRNGGHFD